MFTPELKNDLPLQLLQSKPRFFSVVPEFFLDFYRAELIMVSKLTEINLLTSKPSLLIRPALPPEITMFYGYQNAAKIIESGEESTRIALPKIKELLF